MMNIKHVTYFVLLSMLATGCSQQSQPSGAEVAAPQSVAASEATEKPARGALREALPQGVRLNFEHHVRNDRVVEREGRSDRRRMGVEYLNGDQETTFTSVEASLAGAGFELRERKDMDNGNIRAKFSKPGYGTVVVTVTKDMGDATPRNEAAIGRVMLDWPMPASEG